MITSVVIFWRYKQTRKYMTLKPWTWWKNLFEQNIATHLLSAKWLKWRINSYAAPLIVLATKGIESLYGRCSQIVQNGDLNDPNNAPWMIRIATQHITKPAVAWNLYFLLLAWWWIPGVFLPSVSKGWSTKTFFFSGLPSRSSGTSSNTPSSYAY